MDETNRLNHNKYAYLRQLPIDKLLELLAVAPALSDRPEDEAYMSALGEAIIEKENENPTGFFPDVDQLWEQFMTHYLPNIEDIALEPERTEHAISAQVNQQPLEVPPKSVVRFRRVWRTALVAAAAVVCVFGIMLTAQAAGIDVFGTMARWTEDIFSFGRISPDSVASDNLNSGTTGQEFSSLQEALDAYGLTEVHEPAWLPEGYALDDIDVLAVDDPFLRTFAVSYTDGEERVSIGVMSYEGKPLTQVQKTDDPVESIENNGVIFYRFKIREIIPLHGIRISMSIISLQMGKRMSCGKLQNPCFRERRISVKKKWPIHILPMLLCVVMLCNIPAYAVEARASSRIAYSAASLSKKSDGDISVYFSVRASDVMEKVGASSVEIQRSSGCDWVTEYTFTIINTPTLLRENKDWHSMVLTYSPRYSGMEYRAVVMIYVKDASGASTQNLTSNTLDNGV